MVQSDWEVVHQIEQDEVAVLVWRRSTDGRPEFVFEPVIRDVAFDAPDRHRFTDRQVQAVFVLMRSADSWTAEQLRLTPHAD